MCSSSQGMLSRLPLLWGVSSLVALLAAFAGGSWLHTREPVTLPNSNTAAIISFTIGLWRVCPHLESKFHKMPSNCNGQRTALWEQCSKPESQDYSAQEAMNLCQRGGHTWLSETTQHFLKLNCYDVIAIEDSNRNFPCSVEEVGTKKESVDLRMVEQRQGKQTQWCPHFAQFYVIYFESPKSSVLFNLDKTSNKLFGTYSAPNNAWQIEVHMPSLSCSLVKYNMWEDVTSSDLGIWTTLNFAQYFVSRMRSSTLLTGLAIVLLLIATIFSFLGHCKDDSMAIIACGFFILGGLFLGTALVIFSSAISETLAEIWEYDKETPWGPKFDHQYGWCFFVAGISFIMANSAALFSILAYLNRFSSVDDMLPDFGLEALDPLGAMASALDPHSSAQTLAGQTIPIVIKKHNMSPPLSFSNLPSKYGTIHYSGGSMHQDFFGISGIEESTSFSDYYGKSKTLQQPRRKKKMRRDRDLPSARI
ncbi:hypothetical protein NQ317_001974 [Molorchus minor]|uniref:Uncharacterized protein n=1 Tax=Molorchus minor TaxID=1323400 RepID=A0ABQ9ITX9_9CUCU|nr:hypothetical protein NQ317_001974 [Molorchus minor]